MVKEPLRIAIRRGKTWTVDDWKSIDFNQEEGWKNAIDIFEDRIRGRFLDVVEAIQGKEGTGFAVMALDSLLIETLQQFREGVEETPNKQSGEYFCRFLTHPGFDTYFDNKSAKLFFEKIRCGILHMAEIKGDSIITTRESIPLVTLEGADSLVINRLKFHAIMEKVFQDYVTALHKNDPVDKELRRRFKYKMDCICHVPVAAGKVL